MKVSVNKETCIGCSMCASICDKVFHIVDDKAEVRNDLSNDTLKFCEDDIKSCVDSCPVGAIEVSND